MKGSSRELQVLRVELPQHPTGWPPLHDEVYPWPLRGRDSWPGTWSTRRACPRDLGGAPPAPPTGFGSTTSARDGSDAEVQAPH
jgi:hypothetical protein